GNVVHHSFGRVEVDVGDLDRGTLGAEQKCGRLADSSSCPGDAHDGTVEVAHHHASGRVNCAARSGVASGRWPTPKYAASAFAANSGSLVRPSAVTLPSRRIATSWQTVRARCNNCSRRMTVIPDLANSRMRA